MSQLIEFTFAGEKPKKLIIPVDSILTFEETENGIFVRYDYGAGLSFCFVANKLDYVMSLVPVANFLQVKTPDGARQFLRLDLFIAASEVEDEGVELTRVDVRISGGVMGFYVLDSVDEIKQQFA